MVWNKQLIPFPYWLRAWRDHPLHCCRLMTYHATEVPNRHIQHSSTTVCTDITLSGSLLGWFMSKVTFKINRCLTYTNNKTNMQKTAMKLLLNLVIMENTLLTQWKFHKADWAIFRHSRYTWSEQQYLRLELCGCLTNKGTSTHNLTHNSVLPFFSFSLLHMTGVVNSVTINQCADDTGNQNSFTVDDGTMLHQMGMLLPIRCVCFGK